MNINPALIIEYAVPCSMSFETAKKLIQSIKHREVSIVRANTDRIDRVLMHVFTASKVEKIYSVNGLVLAKFVFSNAVIKFDDMDIQIKYVSGYETTEDFYPIVKNMLKHDLHRHNLPHTLSL